MIHLKALLVLVVVPVTMLAIIFALGYYFEYNRWEREGNGWQIQVGDKRLDVISHPTGSTTIQVYAIEMNEIHAIVIDTIDHWSFAGDIHLFVTDYRKYFEHAPRKVRSDVRRILKRIDQRLER